MPTSRLTDILCHREQHYVSALLRFHDDRKLKRETKVLTNSEKDGYKKRSRSVYGPDYIENALAPTTVEMTG